MFAAFALILLLAAYGFFALRRLRVLLRYFQQDEYDAPRFLGWIVAKRAFDRQASLVLAATGLLALGGLAPSWLPELLAAAGLALIGRRQIDPTKTGKKKLVLTERARRILYLALGVLLLAAALCAGLGLPLILWIVLAQAVPLGLCAATALLAPYETRNNRRFIIEAREKLATLRPIVVGITGSFGKTSVKHILGHVLASHQPTLITPGSVNTELGISRIVRERLTPRERFFVCEMGAYGIGSIARLCRLTQPKIGVITAIGAAHYERFRSLDAVARAKFELAEAVFANGGQLVAAEEVLQFAAARALIEANRNHVLLVGRNAAADVRIAAERQTATGTEIELAWQGGHWRLATPLFGAHHAGNMALAFATAVAIGVPVENIALAMRGTPQIRHRSEIRRHGSGATIIDDAYNSNPAGFAGALALLDLFRQPGGRRILVTPGMVELGAAHDAEHARLGAVAARHVDTLLAVLPERQLALVEAYQSAQPHGEVLRCGSFAEADAWMKQHLAAADAVLLENDLPDLYESPPVF